ncbi:MAG TPA: hypothetical protein VIZ18_17925 [Ktedonobacteraceae bacterium]
MCRLLGYVARQPVIAEDVLEDSLAAFIDVSHLHADGWGLAWYDEQGHMQQVWVMMRKLAGRS